MVWIVDMELCFDEERVVEVIWTLFLVKIWVRTFRKSGCILV